MKDEKNEKDHGTCTPVVERANDAKRPAGMKLGDGELAFWNMEADGMGGFQVVGFLIVVIKGRRYLRDA